MGKITVATSIAPRNLEPQKLAIASWQSLGFNVISTNLPSEVASLSPYFPFVRFIPVDRSAEDYTGTPYVFFDDILAALDAHGTEVCGIINSDIHIRAFGDFPRFVANMANNAFLFGSRVDVESLEYLDREVYFTGFDFFFFDRQLVSRYPFSKFCLGAPWWDYWAPAALLIQGVPCRELVTPVAFHQLHETKWSPDLFLRFGKLFVEQMKRLSGENKVSDDFMASVETVKSDADLSRLSFTTLQYIWKNSEQVSCQSMLVGGVSTLVLGKRQLKGLRAQLGKSLEQIESLHADLDAVNNLVVELQKQAATLQGTLSWRLTAPLRKIIDIVRKAKR